MEYYIAGMCCWIYAQGMSSTTPKWLYWCWELMGVLLMLAAVLGVIQ